MRRIEVLYSKTINSFSIDWNTWKKLTSFQWSLSKWAEECLRIPRTNVIVVWILISLSENAKKHNYRIWDSDRPNEVRESLQYYLSVIACYSLSTNEVTGTYDSQTALAKGAPPRHSSEVRKNLNWKLSIGWWEGRAKFIAWTVSRLDTLW